MSDPKSLKDALDSVAGRLGLAPARDLGAVWSRWSEIVGEDVAAHAEPSSLRNGVLKVRATTPVWATELAYLAGEIMSRANAVAGRKIVAEVRVWTAPGPVARRHVSGGAESVETPDVPDDPLTALERARRASQARERGRQNDQSPW